MKVTGVGFGITHGQGWVFSLISFMTFWDAIFLSMNIVYYTGVL